MLANFCVKCSLRCEINFSHTVKRENHTSATSERDYHLESEETMRPIIRTLPLGVRLSEIHLQTGVEIFPTLNPSEA